MIEGLVNADYEAVITLSLRGPTGLERELMRLWTPASIVSLPYRRR